MPNFSMFARVRGCTGKISGSSSAISLSAPAMRVKVVGIVDVAGAAHRYHAVDNVLYQADKLARTDTSGFETSAWKAARQAAGQRYGVVTLHRPSNVDDAANFTRIAGALKEIAAELPLIFPVHPRTRANLEKFGIDLGPNITLAGPQAYMAFLNLWKDAAVVLTDSGGLQEETTALGVPCVTIRENTERPVTVDEGSNVLAGTDPAVIMREARKILRGEGKQGRRPHLWDGKAAERIVAVLGNELAKELE